MSVERTIFACNLATAYIIGYQATRHFAQHANPAVTGALVILPQITSFVAFHWRT